MECKAILHALTTALTKLHAFGIVHCDIKPRNAVFGDAGWKLIDMDASTTTGNQLDTSDPGFKWTSAFAAPELARTVESKGQIVAHPSLDVFALGVIAYEVCSGKRLFPQDLCNNSLVDTTGDMTRLCIWLDIPDATLKMIFADPDASCTQQERKAAQHFVRSCLQGDPKLRPSMEELLAFPFLASFVPLKDDFEAPTHSAAVPTLTTLAVPDAVVERHGGDELSQPLLSGARAEAGGARAEARSLGSLFKPAKGSFAKRKLKSLFKGVKRTLSAIDGTPLKHVHARDTYRQRYHIFISHMQAEASGDVGTLFFLSEQMGVHGWRDMNQDNLTEEGMRQGVFDSDVFILFLTNSYLSRKFCIKELTWALEFGARSLLLVLHGLNCQHCAFLTERPPTSSSLSLLQANRLSS